MNLQYSSNGIAQWLTDFRDKWDDFYLSERWAFDKIGTIKKTFGRVLDVGCGDGSIDQLIMKLRPDLRIEGIDVFVRPHPNIAVTKFDGERIPFPDKHFDAVMFVDVLHHTNNAVALLAEASSVSDA